MRTLFAFLTLVLLLPSTVVLAEQETLQNDSFVSGAAVTFQAGFIAGEMAAARFEPQIQCPCVLEKITFLFGGAATSELMGINVWSDVGNSDSPGALLFSGEAQLTGSTVLLQEVDLSLTPIVVNGPFRVGLEFNHDGAPTVASDLDGTIDIDANFIFADIGGLNLWFRAGLLGVSGDFVIRATIDNLIALDSDADGIPDDVDNCSLVANADQRDTDGDDYGNICDADLNNDCQINFADIALIADVFLQTGDLDADLNGDGAVNFIDFSLLTDAFLSVPGPSGVTNECDP